jgi:hypothetical protein
MLHTIEVEIDANGRVRAVQPSEHVPTGRALLTILAPEVDEAAVLAEAALAEDWMKPEEDEAWAHLQPGK